uniref:KANL2-like probable zinc-finger domain-containing protein n=1 Tax=Populus davidiana TaxID=266767 RepID=A0A6M2EX95_9ROSI
MANPPSPTPPQPPDPITIDGAAEDSALSSPTYLTHLELVTQRSRRYKQLAQIYRTHYWTLMEELKVKHKEYCWKYGKIPYKEDEKNKKRKRDFNNDKDIFELNAKLGIRDGGGEAKEEERGEGGLRKCLAAGFKAKAMALTRFCNTHILLDSRQKLYKGCTFDIKSAQGRPVLCQKPVLISTVPSLCPMHFQKAERQVARALKKEGLSFSSPSKLASKLHVVVTEFVRQIQTKRRAALKENVSEDHTKEYKIFQGS